MTDKKKYKKNFKKAKKELFALLRTPYFHLNAEKIAEKFEVDKRSLIDSII